ncbi:type 2 lantipeptide synthetase LanM family protein [Clostridium sporogenes]|nr:type 2 lanthipeptide synthetase LanM family protein [Clostridium sporogenes]UAL58346.1 type 2 lantipeptide synthetase LanM family protein [Clostridium sporogenes]
MKISLKDIKDYWLQIVPEADNEKILKDLVKKACDSDIDYLANSLSNKEMVEDKFLEVLNKKKFYKLDDFISDFRNKVPFYFFYEPFINLSLDKWFNKIQDLHIIYDINVFFQELILCILENISKYASRMLILEINIARMNNQFKNIPERTAFEYYNYELLNDKHYRCSLYSEYNELTKILLEKTDKYFEYIYEVLGNIKDQLENISIIYGKKLVDLKVINIKTGMGDEHKSGKTVAIINFMKGFKLVYKPRNSNIDKVFQETLEWIEKKGKKEILPIKKLKVINNPTFGLVEYINYNECSNIEETRNFYIKIGQLVAVLHSLNAVDFHCENIIADGTNPMLIDLETLFHPYVKIYSNKFETPSQKLANDVIENSVQSIGILPHFIMDESVSDAVIDISGLGGEKEQKSPFKSYVVKNQNTAHMKVVRENLKIPSEKNNPVLNGKVQQSKDYVNEIISGFKACYNVILKNKDEYIDWIMKNFKGSINRVIFRPTRNYTQLLNTSYHPDLLRNAEDRIIFFSRIFSNIEEGTDGIVRLEFNSLINSEIPCFNCSLNSRDIYDMKENIYNNYLEQSPLEIAYKRIMNFSKEDLSLQLRLIHIAFESKRSDYEKDITPIKFNEINNNAEIDSKKYIDLAIKIGNYILNNSIVDKVEKNNRTWVSAILVGRNEVGVGINPVGDDLYNGNCGIALFLIYLGYVTGKEEFIQSASEAMESRRKFIDYVELNCPFPIGAFNGLSGTIYVLDKLIQYGKREYDKEYLAKYINYLNEIIFMDKQYDLMGGAVGCIAVLYPIIKSNHYPDLNSLMKSIINKCCIHLINEKEEIDIGGISWGNVEKSTGFSHGNAGVIAYLSKLLNEQWIENKGHLEEVINEALKFERALYIDKEKNWYKDNKKEHICYGWCHGAPGILLSKCLAKEFRNNDYKWEDELQAALSTTKNKSFGNNPSLCHGDLGNLEIIYIASEFLQDEKLKNHCRLIFHEIYETVIKERWMGKSFRGVDSYNLMIGLSGFGYSLLRFSGLYKIPSVLWLE